MLACEMLAEIFLFFMYCYYFTCLKAREKMCEELGKNSYIAFGTVR